MYFTWRARDIVDSIQGSHSKLKAVGVVVVLLVHLYCLFFFFNANLFSVPELSFSNKHLTRLEIHSNKLFLVFFSFLSEYLTF